MRKKNTYSRFVQNTSGWPDSQKGKMIHLLHCCVENEITTFDNADFRGSKYSDPTFGIALSESGLSRDEIQLISKLKIDKPSELVSRVDEILLNLRTDYLDLLLLNFSSATDEVDQAVEQLISQGKILEIGGFDLQDSQFHSFRLPIRAIQLKSPFRSPEAYKALQAEEFSTEEIIGLVHCYFNESMTEGMETVLTDLSQQYSCSLNQFILIWILNHPGYLHPVLYSSEPEEIAEAVAVKEKRLDPLDWQKIKLILS